MSSSFRLLESSRRRRLLLLRTRRSSPPLRYHVVVIIILLVWIAATIAPVSALLLPTFSASTTSTSTAHKNAKNHDNDDIDDDDDDDAPRRNYDPDLVRYRCRVAYDGTGFCGFQIQHRLSNNPADDVKEMKKKKKGYNNKPQRTVQNELERVLSQRFNRHVRVVGAGRTDSGVHARGQAAHFDLFRHNETKAFEKGDEGKKALQLLQTAMNRMLPPDMRVWNVQPAPEPCLEVPVNKKLTIPDAKKKEMGKKTEKGDDMDIDSDDANDAATTTSPTISPAGIFAWNVMQKATGKLYSYRICLGDSMDPLLRHSRWQIDRPQGITPEMLERILKQYEGTHDFVCFAGALEANARKTGRVIGTVRTVHSVDLVEDGEEGEGLYRIDIRLDGALYKMVRNMVGTAIDVCRAKVTEEQFQGFLQPVEGAGRKSNKCHPAPPQGLTLERVYYEDDDVF